MSRGTFAFAVFLAGCGTASTVPDAASSTDASVLSIEDASVTDAATPSDLALPGHLHAYVGGYAGKITYYDFDRTTGALTNPTSFTAGAQPSFLAIDPTHRRLYAVDEGASTVLAFQIDAASGALSHIGTDRSSGGNGPAHLSIDRSGGWALAANYNDGNIATLAIGSDGTLSAPGSMLHPGNNAHQIFTDVTNHFAFVPCKGSDLIAQYLFDATTGELGANATASVSAPAGSGPRHLVFHPTLARAYSVQENASTVIAYDYDGATGRLTAGASLSTLPAGYADANAAAEIAVHPSGKLLYASNRGHDSLALFTIAANGDLTAGARYPTGGSTPRHFSIDPSGAWVLVANQGSSQLTVFSVDPTTGALTLVGTPVDVTTPSFVAAFAL